MSPQMLSIPEVVASVAIGSVLDDADFFGKGSPIAIGASDEDRIFSNNLNLKRKQIILRLKKGIANSIFLSKCTFYN